MDFFKNFAEQIPGADIQLTIKEKNGTFAVLILPNLGTKKSINPLEVNGSAAELDQDFFKLITTPLQQASAMVTNAKQFAESVQEASKPEPEKTLKKKSPAKKPTINQPGDRATKNKLLAEDKKLKAEKKAASKKATVKKEKPDPVKKEEPVPEKVGPQELTAF